LIIHEDWVKAVAGCGKLRNVVLFPENLYVDCLCFHIASRLPAIA